MPNVVDSRVWTRQPGIVAPIAQRFRGRAKFVYTPNIPVDQLSANSASLTGATAKLKPTLDGLAIETSAANSGITLAATSPSIAASTGYSVLTVLSNWASDSSTSTRCLIHAGTLTGAGPKSTGEIICRNTSYGVSVVANQRSVFALRYKFGVTAKAAINGVLGSEVTNNVNSNALLVDSIGSRASTSTFMAGSVALVVLFEGLLTDAELAQLTVDPWSVFEPEDDFTYFPSGAGTVNLAAAAQAQASATAQLLKGVSLAGAALGVASAGAGMSLSVPLAATAQATASASGQITLTINLAAGAVAQAAATAGMALDKLLAAAAAGQAGATAELGGNTVSLAATAQAQASAGATLTLAVNLGAAAIAQALATAELGGSATLAAAAIANAQASAALALGKPLAAAAAGAASAGATLWLTVPLSAAALAAASAGAGLSLTVPLSAAALASANASAALAGPVGLAANGVAQAGATAALTVISGSATSAGPYVWRQRYTRRSWRGPATRRNWPLAVERTT